MTESQGTVRKKIHGAWSVHRNKVLYTVVLGTVASLIAIVLVRGYDRVEVAPRNYVAVVASERTVDFGIPGEFKAGFVQGMNDRQVIPMEIGYDVAIEYREDGGDSNQATRIAKDLVDDDHCILVVGNSNSTLTAATLEVFLQAENPPAYLLPIATASDLLVRARDAQHDAVLRMVPDNDNQASRVNSLVSVIAPKKRIAIFSDEENAVYSTNLSRAIASRVRDAGGTVLLEQTIGPSHPIVDTIDRWNAGTRSEYGQPTQDKASASVPDVIIYVGLGHHGMLLMDQLQGHSNLKIPIIFTDGCMEASLIRHAGEKGVGGYILSPVRLSPNSEDLPTYEPIGRDAARIVNMLVADCSGCNKQELRRHIAAKRSRGQLELRNGDAGDYTFDPIGQNTAMQYKVYRITGGTLQDFPL